jgi:hypothetical protein
MSNVNMVKAVRVENVIVNTAYQIDGKGEDLFFVGEEGREREAIIIGLGKAKRLLQALNDDPEAFIDQLVAYVHKREGKILAERTPVKTLEFDGSQYGLFQDGAIKVQCERDGKTFWKVVRGRMAEVLTAESFDNPESLAVPVKVVKAARSSSNAAVEALQAQLAAQAAQTAQLQAMMMQLLQNQTSQTPAAVGQ